MIPDERLILFGSQARGNARPDSDWDLLLLVNKTETTLEDERLYAYPFTKLGWDYGKDFSVKLYSKDERQKSDYDVWVDINPQMVLQLLTLAGQFIETIEKLINEQTNGNNS